MEYTETYILDMASNFKYKFLNRTTKTFHYLFHFLDNI